MPNITEELYNAWERRSIELQHVGSDLGALQRDLDLLDRRFRAGDNEFVQLQLGHMRSRLDTLQQRVRLTLEKTQKH